LRRRLGLALECRLDQLGDLFIVDAARSDGAQLAVQSCRTARPLSVQRLRHRLIVGRLTWFFGELIVPTPPAWPRHDARSAYQSVRQRSRTSNRFEVGSFVGRDK
jgi:hypothetical protein